MDVRGIGVDLALISRVREVVERWDERFLRRVFTDREIAYCRRRRDPIPHLAARFAAKEATLKALGTGLRMGVQWREMEVRRERGEAPTMVLSGRCRAIALARGPHLLVDEHLIARSVRVERRTRLCAAARHSHRLGLGRAAADKAPERAGDDLLGRVLGEHPRGARYRAGDHLRQEIAQAGVGVFRIAQEGQVVHRDDPARGFQGRQGKIGGVEQLAGAGQCLGGQGQAQAVPSCRQPARRDVTRAHPEVFRPFPGRRAFPCAEEGILVFSVKPGERGHQLTSITPDPCGLAHRRRVINCDVHSFQPPQNASQEESDECH